MGMKKKKNTMGEAEGQPPEQDLDATDANANAQSESNPDSDTAPEVEPEDDLTRLQRERDQFEDRWKRSVADLENFKRRQRKEVTDTRLRAIEGLTVELLPVLDNFHLALGVQSTAEGAATDPNMIVEGLKMVRSMLEGTLERHGLAEIPSEGKTFDPNIHEAVGIDSESDAEPGTVTRIMQRGYKIGDKILRASRVLVSGEAQSESSKNEND